MRPQNNMNHHSIQTEAHNLRSLLCKHDGRSGEHWRPSRSVFYAAVIFGEKPRSISVETTSSANDDDDDGGHASVRAKNNEKTQTYNTIHLNVLYIINVLYIFRCTESCSRSRRSIFVTVTTRLFSYIEKYFFQIQIQIIDEKKNKSKHTIHKCAAFIVISAVGCVSVCVFVGFGVRLKLCRYRSRAVVGQ